MLLTHVSFGYFLVSLSLAAFGNASSLRGEISDSPPRLRGIDATQHGVDLCMADVYSSNGGIISGVTSIYVFKHKWDYECATADFSNLLPNCACWDYDAQAKCSLSVNQQSLRSAQDYCALNAESMSLTYEDDDFFSHESSTTTTDYAEVQSWCDEKDNVLIQSAAECVTYQFHCENYTKKEVDLNPAFYDVLANIPFESQDVANTYLDLNLMPKFRKYTVTGAKMGGRSGAKYYMTQDAYNALTAEGYSYTEGAQESFDAMAIGKGGAGTGTVAQVGEIGATLNAKSSNIVWYSIGEAPVQGQSWLDLVAERPAMIAFDLIPHCDWLTEEFFNMSSADMEIRKNYCLSWTQQPCALPAPSNVSVTNEFRLKVPSAESQSLPMIPVTDGMCFLTTVRAGNSDEFYFVSGTCGFDISLNPVDGLNYYYLRAAYTGSTSSCSYCYVDCGARCLVNSTWYSFDNLKSQTSVTTTTASTSSNSTNISEDSTDTCVLSTMTNNVAKKDQCSLMVGTAWALNANHEYPYSNSYAVSCGAMCFERKDDKTVEDFSLDGDMPAVSVTMWKTDRGYCRVSRAQATSGTCSIQDIEISGLSGKYWVLSAGCNDNGTSTTCVSCTATCESY
jgi:hypothetical protein